MVSTGGGTLPLVLLHGLTDSAACWPSVRAEFAGEREVIALNARGHGGAPLPEEPFTITALAADAARALRDVGPAIVLGHSMGGATAEALALHAPESVAALILEDPAWRGGAEDGGAPVWLRDTVRRLAGRSAADLAELAARECAGWPAVEVDGWIEAKRGLDPRIADVSQQWQERDWVAAMAEVRVPVTLITGENARGSIVTPEQVSQVQAALGERLTHVPVAGVGHNIRREGPSAFIAAVRAAVRRADHAER